MMTVSLAQYCNTVAVGVHAVCGEIVDDTSIVFVHPVTLTSARLTEPSS